MKIKFANGVTRRQPKMKTTTPLLLLLALLCACGGAPTTQNATARQQDPRLVAMWQQVETTLATQGANLTAALPGLPAQWVYPGAAAEQVPFNVTVNTIPDLTVAQLQQENPGVTLQHNTDPTGVIHCAANAGGARYCAGFTQGSNIFVAASQLYNIGATGWEMENAILAELGYNTSGR